MSAVALAATPAAPHPQPLRAATGVRPRDGGGTTIRVPLRLVVGAQYPDVALSVYVKIAALALRPEGCTAKVAVLADYLGMSKSSVERGLKALQNEDDEDGVTEVFTTRRTLPGGRGQSAHRTVRPLDGDEFWVRIPVRAAEALTPRLLRVYAILAYAEARGTPLTEAELGQMLHHHTGEHAGESLSARQASRLVDEIDAAGWMTVRRREGEQGRNTYEAERRPLRSAPAPAPAGPVVPDGGGQLALWGEASADIHDGSGADDHDGSLASEEDRSTDRPEKTEPGGGIRRRRGDRKWPTAPVENPGGQTPATFARAGLGLRPDATPPTPAPTTSRPPYTGPSLQLSPRVWRVLTPVHHHLPTLSPYMLRRIAREIGTQLDTPGGSEARLTDRLTRRYASTDTIRDISRWLLGAALVRHGCGDPRCETGVIWDTGTGCETCALNRQVEAARAARDAELAEKARLLEEQRRARLRQTGPGPAPLPRKLSFREREQAGDDEIRAVLAVHGPVTALHLYGHLRVLPLLHHPDAPFGAAADGGEET
ncbi:hypothetical protein [Streptomyces antibioticus]|uniref:hypothetical protein n=1 Tax=Streptomyces antibioticus TaxID=1890 RepID=UPI0036F60EC2